MFHSRCLLGLSGLLFLGMGACKPVSSQQQQDGSAFKSVDPSAAPAGSFAALLDQYQEIAPIQTVNPMEQPNAALAGGGLQLDEQSAAPAIDNSPMNRDDLRKLIQGLSQAPKDFSSWALVADLNDPGVLDLLAKTIDGGSAAGPGAAGPGAAGPGAAGPGAAGPGAAGSVNLPGLALGDDTDLETLRTLLARLGADPFVTALGRDPRQLPCAIDGGILSAAKECQCRSWGMPIDGYTWTADSVAGSGDDTKMMPGDRLAFAARGVRAGVLSPGHLRKCPNLERLYCHGWPARAGVCGLFTKGADYQTKAIGLGKAVSGVSANASLKDASAACFANSAYDQVIKANVAAVFSSANGCGVDQGLGRDGGAYFGLLNGDKIEIHLFKSDGTWDSKATMANHQGLDAASELTGQSVSQIQTLCTRAGGQTVDSSDSCRCGGTTMERSEINNYLTSTKFQSSCKSLMAGVGGDVETNDALAAFQRACPYGNYSPSRTSGGATCKCVSQVQPITAATYNAYSSSDKLIFPTWCAGTSK